MLKLRTTFTILLILTMATLVLGARAKSNLPISREAVILETSSPSEILIKAVGYGTGSKKAEELDQRANMDARKAAVWFLLFSGSDPLLTTEAERANFAKIQEQFFEPANLKPFISWEADYYDSRLRLDEQKLKIEKSLKINKTLLQDNLVQRGIIQAPQAIAAIVGMPTIMVLPEKQGDQAPLELLRTDPNLKKGAEVIESFLTARQFTVIVPEQQQALNELASAHFNLQGESEDYSYMLALSIGSDIYATYNVKVESRRLGTSTVKKGIVACRAFETTTARLLGTETGYSQERPAADAVVIEEAMNDAASKVLDRIVNYWKLDCARGVQYKLVVNVNQTFEPQAAETIIEHFVDLVKKMARNYQENAVADYTYDVLLWCDPMLYRTSSDVYRFLRQNYKGSGVLQKVSVNRKLILLNIVAE